MQSGVRWPWLPGLGGQLVMLPGLCSVPSKPQHLYKLHVEIQTQTMCDSISRPDRSAQTNERLAFTSFLPLWMEIPRIFRPPFPREIGNVCFDARDRSLLHVILPKSHKKWQIFYISLDLNPDWRCKGFVPILEQCSMPPPNSILAALVTILWSKPILLVELCFFLCPDRHARSLVNVKEGLHWTIDLAEAQLCGLHYNSFIRQTVVWPNGDIAYIATDHTALVGRKIKLHGITILKEELRDKISHKNHPLDQL